jgi:hypothetical protein
VRITRPLTDTPPDAVVLAVLTAVVAGSPAVGTDVGAAPVKGDVKLTGAGASVGNVLPLSVGEFYVSFAAGFIFEARLT